MELKRASNRAWVTSLVWPRGIKAPLRSEAAPILQQQSEPNRSLEVRLGRYPPPSAVQGEQAAELISPCVIEHTLAP